MTIDMTEAHKILSELRAQGCGSMILGSLTGATSVTLYPRRGKAVTATHDHPAQAIYEAYRKLELPRPGLLGRLTRLIGVGCSTG